MKRIVFFTTCLVCFVLFGTQYTIVDLFAGIGGLSYGFSQYPEFKVLAANEYDLEIAKAYELNHPGVIMLTCGVEDVTSNMIQKATGGVKVDLVIGGPPCQSYSTAGKRQMDERANLFREYKRMLEILKPRAFIFENVQGLLSMDDGKLIGQIEDEFKSIGYSVKHKLLDAANYGVPQHRNRVILVGFRGENRFLYPAETHGTKEGLIPWVTLKDALGDLPVIKSGGCAKRYMTPPQNDYQREMRKRVGDELTEYESPQNGENIVRIMEMLKEGQDKFDLPEDIRPKGGFANTYGKLWWDRPAGTITRNFGTPSSARCIHPRDSRALTIREGARLQSFPDDYKLFGSNGKKRLEIGNAVPPLLAKALAKQMIKALSADVEAK